MTAFKQLADSQQRSGRQDLNLRPLAPQASALFQAAPRPEPGRAALRLQPVTEVWQIEARVAIGCERRRARTAVGDGRRISARPLTPGGRLSFTEVRPLSRKGRGED